MRKLHGLFTIVSVAAVFAGVNVASATPPTGQVGIQEHGRAQQAAGTITIPAADNVSAAYTIAPGGDTGWRTSTGDAVVAVFKGALTVEQAAQDCAGQDVKAGNAAVVSTGKYRLRNAGNEPAEFSGLFFNLPVGGPNPLVDGQTEPAPACAGVSTAAVTAQGVSATESARGAIPEYGPRAAHGAGNHS